MNTSISNAFIISKCIHLREKRSQKTMVITKNSRRWERFRHIVIGFCCWCSTDPRVVKLLVEPRSIPYFKYSISLLFFIIFICILSLVTYIVTCLIRAYVLIREGGCSIKSTKLFSARPCTILNLTVDNPCRKNLYWILYLNLYWIWLLIAIFEPW